MCSGFDTGDVVGRAIQGDCVALKLLLTNSHPRLRGYVAGRIPPDLARVVDTNDLVQEAYIEVFRRIGSFEACGPDSFFRWVATMTLHKLRNAIKYYRSAKRGGGSLPITHAPNNMEDSAIALLEHLTVMYGVPAAFEVGTAFIGIDGAECIAVGAR